MTRPSALALTTLALLTVPVGWNPRQTNKAPQPPAAVDSSSKPQIESKLLRIEFGSLVQGGQPGPAETRFCGI